MMEITMDGPDRKGPTYDPKPHPHPFVYAEAFALMQYRCEKCGAMEVIWNSRDGVSPFSVECAGCGGLMQHVNWNKDRRMPGYRPGRRQRVFANVTRERAAECARQRVESAVGTQYEIAAEEREAFIERLACDIYGDGTGPMVITGEEWERQRTEAAIRVQVVKTEVARQCGMFGPRHQHGHGEPKGNKVDRVRRRKAQRAARRRNRR